MSLLFLSSPNVLLSTLVVVEKEYTFYEGFSQSPSIEAKTKTVQTSKAKTLRDELGW